MPIQRQSEYFLNTILNDSGSEILSTGSTESDNDSTYTYSDSESEECYSSDEDSASYSSSSNSSIGRQKKSRITTRMQSVTENDFVLAYNDLYTRWINLHQ